VITYLKVAVDKENGEAWFTAGSIQELKNLSMENGVLGADVTRDIMFHAEVLYLGAVDTFSKQFEAQRKAAKQ
jgi:hypothetical protein